MIRSRTKTLATGLLGLMVLVFVAARSFESQYPALSWVRAFAEAAMVGALADWFAVVALFRHPLGIPIPHTAVIPHRKNQIAKSLATFVQENFLTAERITAKLRKADLARKIAQWLAQPENARRLASRFTQNLPRVLDAIDDQDMQRFIRENVLGQVRRIALAPVAGKLFEVLSESGRDQQLFEQALQLSRRIVGENETLIKGKITQELSAIPDWPVLTDAKALLSQSLAGKVVEKVQGTMDEILGDPSHPVRKQFDQRFRRFIEDLKHSPEMAAKADQLKESLLANEAITGSLDALWHALKSEIVSDLSREDSRVHAQLAEAIQRIGEGTASDDAFRAKVDGWIDDAVSGIVDRHGHEIGDMIRETVESWDAREVSEKLESQVGDDLQFIRINGTLVGGLVGLTIHALGHVFWR